MDAVREWIFGILGAALMTGAAMALTPKGRVRSVLQVLCGAAMALSFLGPLASFDWSAYAQSVSVYRDKSVEASGEIEEMADSLSRTIIEREFAAYILDKAQVYGLSVGSVKVTAKWGDEGLWYPYEAYIEAEKEDGELKKLIESELGIPEERQSWEAYG